MNQATLAFYNESCTSVSRAKFKLHTGPSHSAQDFSEGVVLPLAPPFHTSRHPVAKTFKLRSNAFKTAKMDGESVGEDANHGETTQADKKILGQPFQIPQVFWAKRARTSSPHLHRTRLFSR